MVDYILQGKTLRSLYLSPPQVDVGFLLSATKVLTLTYGVLPFVQTTLTLRGGCTSVQTVAALATTAVVAGSVCVALKKRKENKI